MDNLIIDNFESSAKTRYLIDFARNYARALVALTAEPNAVRWIKKNFPDVRTSPLIRDKYELVFSYDRRYSGVPIADLDQLSSKPLSEFRSYNPLRVSIFGPESTGKSTLAKMLATHYNSLYVPEYARLYGEMNNNNFSYNTVSPIARGQSASERALALQEPTVLFCDTDMLAHAQWSDALYSLTPPWVRRAAARSNYDLTLLLDIDVPFVADAQRCFPSSDARKAFFERCESSLIENGRSYVLISGEWQQRFERAKRAVDLLLEKNGATRI